ncbi:glycosyltransferase [Hippea alviniae]|uniref:glycosyltransferase n=1 Tax=Hippea alviniae TaxID=1279027 RepID=UPI0003B4CBD5|nr:glycosyltransferase [Hippea alviniae]
MSYPNIFQLWYGYDDTIPKKYEIFIKHNSKIFAQIESYKLLKTSQINRFLDEFGYDLSKFKGFHFRFQSDIIRFLLLYHYGGLYLDLDIKLSDNFFELLNILQTEFEGKDAMPSNKRIYFLWFQKGSENLRKMINYYMSLEYLDYDYNVFSFSKINLENIELISTDRLNLYLKHFVLSG